jgi:hypothetical protein
MIKSILEENYPNDIFLSSQAILQFMYNGEVNVAQEDLNSFLSMAEDLKVKGLTQNASADKSNNVASMLSRNQFYESQFRPQSFRHFFLNATDKISS